MAAAARSNARTSLFRRRWFLAAAGVLVVFAILVALAPLYLRGYVRGVIEREVGARVNGTVTVDAVRLGWFSPQRVERLLIDGDDATGSVAADAEVAEGLLALATGDTVTVRLSGVVKTPIDAEGRLGIGRLARADEGAAPSAATPAVPPSTQAKPVFGGRAVRIDLDGIDLEVTSDGEPLHAIEGLRGHVAASDAERGTIALSGELKAKTRIGAAGAEGEPQRTGSVELRLDALVARRGDGTVDLAATSGSVKIDGNGLPLPSPDGDVVMDSVRATASVGPTGVSLSAASAVTIGGSAPATVDATVRTGALFGNDGAFALDPATLDAEISVKALPMAALQPFGPEIAPGTRLDFLADIGETADFGLIKKSGGRASVRFDARRLRFAFDAAVASDGSRIEDGTLAASASVRPELLRALGVDAAGPLVVLVDGSRMEWRKSERPLDGVGGTVSVELARPIVLRGIPDGTERGLELRAEALRTRIDKPFGASRASVEAAFDGAYGAGRPAKATVACDLDLAPFGVTRGTVDASVALDPTLVDRWTRGAVALAREGNTARLTLSTLAFRPEPARGEAKARSMAETLRALEASGRLVLEGEVVVTGAKNPARVRELGVDFALPARGAPGSVEFSARVDGAEVRVAQKFPAFPMTFDDPAALGLEGSVAVRGLDPSVIARLVPDAKDAVGALGTGTLSLTARNRTDGAALVADLSLASSAVTAKGAVRYTKDSLRANDLQCEAALTPELLRVARVPESIAIAPGARATVRASAIEIARGAGGWAPSGDLAARLVVDRLRLERAPGLEAALDVPRLEVEAAYSPKDARASARGSATLGAGGAAGRVGYDLVWRKPVEAKLFRGVEGTVSLAQFDLARIEGSLGLEPGGYSGMLGGAGDCTVGLAERDSARATMSLRFPKTRGEAMVEVVEKGARRTVRANGSLDAQLAADAVGALVGFGDDARGKGPTRKVTSSVDAKLTVKSASAPLDDELKPVLADLALDVTGSLTPLSIEVTDVQGKRTTVSTGALTLAVASARLSDELSVKVSGGGKSGAKDGRFGAEVAGAETPKGGLDLDARVRGAVARTRGGTASPVVDATLKATAFPAATVDALAGTRGAVARYLGDAIDGELVAKGLSKSSGTLAAKLGSQYATLDAPALMVGDGFLRSGAEKPMTANFTLSSEVREQLLAPINPVFADVTSKDRARFTLSSLSWPLDGDRRKFDAAFTLETGEIALTNSGPLSFLLGMLSADRTEGFEASIDPLRATVSKGRLTYRDFSLRAGKTRQGTWKNSLIFSGDIDLAASPIYANEIKTVVPLSDAANWSNDARRAFEAVGAASPALLKSLTVGVKMSGPLFDAAGKPTKPQMELALPDLGDVLRDNPGAIIEGIGGIIDAIRKKDRNK